jgi:hypothetical protein
VQVKLPVNGEFVVESPFMPRYADADAIHRRAILIDYPPGQMDSATEAGLNVPPKITHRRNPGHHAAGSRKYQPDSGRPP